MKTTLELPDELFREAKITAAKRKTTLKSLIEHALRRELYPTSANKEAANIEISSHGLPRLIRPTGEASVTSSDVYQLADEERI